MTSRANRLGRALARASVFAVFAVVGSGCVTVAEHRKLEREVRELKRMTAAGTARGQLADLAAETDALQAAVRDLRGRIDVVEKTATDALADARRARRAAATPTAAVGTTNPGEAEDLPADQPASAELVAYRAAYATWRSEGGAECIEQFQRFLQTYPGSPYADDAAFWMADCHFKQGEFKTAVLRFDDVVRKYPSGNKAPEALFRQGESLLKLGPGYHDAAKRSFQRVLEEYPGSARAKEAKRRLDLLAGTG